MWGAVPITIPKLGLTMEEGTLVEWMKADGDAVQKGDILYALETDKIANEVEADQDGFLKRAVEEDTLHAVGAVVGYLFDSKEDALSAPVPEDAGVSAEEPLSPAEKEASAETPVTARVETMRADGAEGRILISPVARRLASESGLAIEELDPEGSGPGGAILKRDVERQIADRADRPTEKLGAGPSRRPLKGMRRTIATRMMQSLQGTAQMTAFARAEMRGTVALRTELAAQDESLGIRVTYTDILVKLVATVLMEMPGINAGIIGDEIVEWPDANIGIAVALDEGLIVPVLQRANAKSLVEIAKERQRLVDAARKGMLKTEDMEGGTFSISNFGSYGGDFETPILNPPQSAILGFGQITDEPVVRDGEIVIRPMMMLSMTFDHRLIDGAEAGAFRARLKRYLETPSLQLAHLK
jgi:pyruvate dehydrogenase E2 component (dihydrolipoamide acetyltransferase)